MALTIVIANRGGHETSSLLGPKAPRSPTKRSAGPARVRGLVRYMHRELRVGEYDVRGAVTTFLWETEGGASRAEVAPLRIE